MTFAQRPHPENGVRGWAINFSCIVGDDCNVCVWHTLCVCECVYVQVSVCQRNVGYPRTLQKGAVFHTERKEN